MRFLILFLLLLSVIPAFSQLPSTPTNVSAQATGSTTVAVTWNPVATAIGYVVFRDGVEVTVTTNLNFNDSGLTAGTEYTYTVASRNTVGDSSQSLAAVVTTLLVPDPPGGLTATSPTSTTVVLDWDNVAGAIEYTVYRDGNEVGTPTASTFTDTGLTPNTTYEYTVDVLTDGGFSEESAAVSVTTIGDGDGKQQAWARAFRRDDFNNDGEVSWDEYLLAKGGRLAWVIVRNRFVNSDKDGNESLTLAEYADALGGRKYLAPKKPGQFFIADLDEDGLLDPSEFALTQSARMSPVKAMRKFNKLDRNDTGLLSQVEFGIRRGSSEDDF